MAAYPKPNFATFRAGGTIVKGHALKLGADAKHVVECTASTDKAIGIANNSTTTLEDPVEVFLPGGGCEFKAQTTITVGQLVVPHTDGTIKPVSAANDRHVAVALDSAVAGDLTPGMVVLGQATATEA